jgi:hypothetical protein
MLAPLPAHLKYLPPAAPDSLPMVQVMCGSKRCMKNGFAAYWGKSTDGRSLWRVYLAGNYPQTPRDPGIWRLTRIRRRRMTSLGPDQVIVDRDSGGRLQMRGPGMGTARPVPVVPGPVEYDRDKRKVPAAVNIGILGVHTPDEIVIVCQNGHHSHLTAERLDEEVNRAQQRAKT